MARLGLIPLDRMTPEQRRLNDLIAGKRVGARTQGPYGILLHHPALCEKVVAVADFLRDEASVPRQLVEIVVLTVARHWTSQYAWFAHARHADRFGLAPDMVEAIRTNRPPVIRDKTQAVVHRMTVEIMRDRALSDETYDTAARLLGEQALIEIIATIGYYQLVATILAGFQVDVPEGETRALPE